MTKIEILQLKGQSARPYLAELAALRMRVFRDFPYLYEGQLAYEQRYLERYFTHPESFIALVRDSEAGVIGASTAIPLIHEDEGLLAPFRAQKLAPERVMYFGESVLLPAYRGQGLGKSFFELRLAHARQTPGISHAAFCAVIRSDSHPQRPAAYRPLDGLWQSFGFAAVPGMLGTLSWQDLNEPSESPKTLQFWLKNLEDRS